ncbi:PIN domain-like protein [Ceratobasidium sp. AG-I]|nr:PIN domain-like protein [Ceratobasidium sp. AG-I]
MGVHGLATFLRENRRALSSTQVFTNLLRSENDNYTPLVVDGWSLIYALSADSGLPWVYGGEYESFAGFVQAIVKAWLLVGLEPYFVFDGPTPLAKIPMTLKRLTETNIRNANIFFRTSAPARAVPSFLASARISPPLLLEACLDALRELQAGVDEPRVHVLMADGEADPFCVALAAALGGGLVVGMDSDFAVLCTDGYRGYIPIDEMVWQASGEQVVLNHGGEDDGFQAVVAKQRPRRKLSGLIPPPSGSEPGDISLTVAVYHPHTLASHLRLSPALLPLFSALVGNDFSNPANSRKFFENRSSAMERVWKVAHAVSAASLSGIKKGQASGRTSGRGHRSGDTVLDVIHAAVTQLLVRPDLIASGEVDKIVDETVDAALECTIPPVSAISSSSEMCALHSTEECPLAFALGGGSAELLRAYREGRLNRRLLSAVTMGIMLPKVFLEDPDQRSCAVVAKGTWSWVWAVLAAGGHVFSSSDKQTTGSRASANPKSQADDDTDSHLEDESELISVVEDFTATEPSVSSDPTGLASELAERLKGLAGSWDDIHDDDSRQDGTEQAERSLVQYVRRGLKLIPEPVVLNRLSDLAPNISLPGGSEGWARAGRISVFLEGMKSNAKALRDAFEACLAGSPASAPTSDSNSNPLNLGVLIWICVLRCVIQASAESPGGTNGNGNAALVGKWKKAEACAFIASMTVSAPASPSTPVNGSSTLDPPPSDAITPPLPPLDTRTIHRVAQLLYAFDAGARLAEVVYLFEGVSTIQTGFDENQPNEHMGGSTRDIIGRAVRMFSGRAVHAAASTSSVQVDGRVWALVCDGLDGSVWAYEPERAKTKSKSKGKSKSNGGAAGQGGGKSAGRSVGFGLLAALGDE